ncbi:hypothetical protein ACRDU6_18190 [Mycolicibacterium sp. ELW1]|uniref:hypothetical protein n=1 Tax=unclassified Mycolicibacterium TaxID=2636767 RepID=UPI00143D3A93
MTYDRASGHGLVHGSKQRVHISGTHSVGIRHFARLNPNLTNETMLTFNAKVDNNGDDPALWHATD